MSKLVMGYWDCPICGNKEIRGDITNCPSCGRARGDVQFYLKNIAEGEIREENDRNDIEYLSEEEAKNASRNPDWYCSFCNSLNHDNAQTCGNCGATRIDSEANYFDRLKKRKEAEAAELAAQGKVPTAKPKSRLLLILAVIVLLVVGAVVWLNGNKTAGDLKVTALSWTRVIHVERYVEESDWTLPNGADKYDEKIETRMVPETRYRTERVQRTKYNQVLDHYETYYTYNDLGNGKFEEVAHERPVYRNEPETYWEDVTIPYTVDVPRNQTKYYYRIWRVDSSLDLIATGNSHDTAWPIINLGENQREAQSVPRDAEYCFTVEHTKKQSSLETYSLAEDEWMKINIGDQIFITTKRSGADPFISDEKGNKLVDIQKVN